MELLAKIPTDEISKALLTLNGMVRKHLLLLNRQPTVDSSHWDVVAFGESTTK